VLSWWGTGEREREYMCKGWSVECGVPEGGEGGEGKNHMLTCWCAPSTDQLFQRKARDGI
jgi:hypothetical protein